MKNSHSSHNLHSAGYRVEKAIGRALPRGFAFSVITEFTGLHWHPRTLENIPPSRILPTTRVYHCPQHSAGSSHGVLGVSLLFIAGPPAVGLFCRSTCGKMGNDFVFPFG
jgi:hypothetical protein